MELCACKLEFAVSPECKSNPNPQTSIPMSALGKAGHMQALRTLPQAQPIALECPQNVKWLIEAARRLPILLD